MAEAQTFRTSINGFHKGDVTAYITKTAAEHRAEIQSLQEKISELQLENAWLREQVARAEETGRLPVTEKTETAPEAARVPENEAAPEDLSPEAEQVPEEDPLESRELAAYRRAEAMERLAYSRVRKLYGEMEGICGRSANQLDQSEAAAQTAVETIEAQLAILREAVASVQTALTDSARDLRAMDQMVPDPAEGLEEA